MMDAIKMNHTSDQGSVAGLVSTRVLHRGNSGIKRDRTRRVIISILFCQISKPTGTHSRQSLPTSTAHAVLLAWQHNVHTTNHQSPQHPKRHSDKDWGAVSTGRCKECPAFKYCTVLRSRTRQERLGPFKKNNQNTGTTNRQFPNRETNIP